MDLKKVAEESYIKLHLRGMKLHLRGRRKILVDKRLLKISNRSINPTFVDVALVYNSYTLHRYFLLIGIISDYSYIYFIKVLRINKTK